jgi:uncharacterized protein YdaU (DUF1376 family)
MKRTNTLPFFQIDSGQVLSEAMGRPLEDMGLYLLLMAIYWEGECRLPARDVLLRKLQIKGKKVAALDRLITELFPDGIHEQLDHQRENALKTSQRNAENVRRRYGNPQKSQESSGSPQGVNSGADDF